MASTTEIDAVPQASPSPRQRTSSPLGKALGLGSSSDAPSPVSVLRSGARGAPVVVVSPPSPEDLRREIGEEERGGERGSGPLYVMHGLPADFLNVVGGCMGIDRAFVDAHAARTCYRPEQAWRDVSWVHWEYPELVAHPADQAVVQRGLPTASISTSDLMSPPVVKQVSREGLSVIFLRVSLWRDGARAVLFLDRVPRKEWGPSWTRPRKQTSVTKLVSIPGTEHDPHVPRAWATQLPQQEETISLAEELHKSMGTGRRMDPDATVEGVVARSVHDHWLQLFESLPPPVSGRYDTEGADLLWQMMLSLEQNLESVLDGERSGHARWKHLLERVLRTLDFKSGTIITGEHVAASEDASSKQDPADPGRKPGHEVTLEDQYDEVDPIGWEEFNQRSLDRITYLGGFMLPLTVVSGILSIEGSYGPEGNQFWVFWVASFISSGICLFIIYLDQLRSLDVWFEVTAHDAVEAMFHNEALEPSSSQGGGLGLDSVQAGGNPGGSTSGDPWRRVFSNRNGGLAVKEGGRLRPLTNSTSSRLGRRTLWTESSKGSGGKAWRRESLGWGGAVKMVAGYYRVRGDNVRFKMPEPDGEG